LKATGFDPRAASGRQCRIVTDEDAAFAGFIAEPRQLPADDQARIESWLPGIDDNARGGAHHRFLKQVLEQAIRRVDPLEALDIGDRSWPDLRRNANSPQFLRDDRRGNA